MFYFDPTMLIVIPAIIFALWAQMNVSSTFKKYSKVNNSRGFTGKDVARKILDNNGLYDVPVEHVSGNLSDHFDPKANVVRLSDTVYDSTSVAAIGVAAHEVGHAIQHATGYAPIKFRMAIVPMTQIGSVAAFPLVIIGILLGSGGMFLVNLGIILYTIVVAFQAITLPVEFNASGRALRTLESEYILEDDELRKSKRVLTAAALTYVAAMATALLTLVRLILISGYGRND
jgi:Zn-dependent membrane protease YugP